MVSRLRQPVRRADVIALAAGAPGGLLVGVWLDRLNGGQLLVVALATVLILHPLATLVHELGHAVVAVVADTAAGGGLRRATPVAFGPHQVWAVLVGLHDGRAIREAMAKHRANAPLLRRRMTVQSATPGPNSEQLPLFD